MSGDWGVGGCGDHVTDQMNDRDLVYRTLYLTACW